jgi:outer membrane murein-binding lipoprotein Lpp
MQTVLAAAVVALLVFSLTSNRSRIDRLEDTVNAGFAAQDARFSELDSRIDELDVKLTALIAALNKSAEVDAAIGGRLLDPAAASPGGAGASGAAP